MDSQMENSRRESVGEISNDGLKIQIITFEPNRLSQTDAEENCTFYEVKFDFLI